MADLTPSPLRRSYTTPVKSIASLFSTGEIITDQDLEDSINNHYNLTNYEKDELRQLLHESHAVYLDNFNELSDDRKLLLLELNNIDDITYVNAFRQQTLGRIESQPARIAYNPHKTANNSTLNGDASIHTAVRIYGNVIIRGNVWAAAAVQGGEALGFKF
jgi:hypothetical protein